MVHGTGCAHAPSENTLSSANTDANLPSGTSTPPMVVVDMVWPDQSNHQIGRAHV